MHGRVIPRRAGIDRTPARQGCAESAHIYPDRQTDRQTDVFALSDV